MTGMAHRAPQHAHEPLILGIILLAVGLGGLALTLAPGSGGLVLLAIGVTLLVLFAITRAYGALVPGGIVTGLGLGVLATETGRWGEDGGLIVAGLGLGFVSIWVLAVLSGIEERHPWPLIPGTILLTVGILLALGDTTAGLLTYWPVVVIAIGLIVLARAFLEERRT